MRQSIQFCSCSFCSPAITVSLLAIVPHEMVTCALQWVWCMSTHLVCFSALPQPKQIMWLSYIGYKGVEFIVSSPVALYALAYCKQQPSFINSLTWKGAMHRSQFHNCMHSVCMHSELVEITMLEKHKWCIIWKTVCNWYNQRFSK